ncbi:DciA family protein [Marinobacteraceae bacterium S3BR75-40.1]
MAHQPPAFDPAREARSEHLKTLLSVAEKHAVLETIVLQAVPETIRPHCRFGGFHDGELTLFVYGSTTASLLRFRQQEILAALRDSSDEFSYAWRLNVKVRPQSTPRRASRPDRSLSKENARLLEEEAGHTKDRGLKQVLEKLAQHVRR